MVVSEKTERVRVRVRARVRKNAENIGRLWHHSFLDGYRQKILQATQNFFVLLLLLLLLLVLVLVLVLVLLLVLLLDSNQLLLLLLLLLLLVLVLVLDQTIQNYKPTLIAAQKKHRPYHGALTIPPPDSVGYCLPAINDFSPDAAGRVDLEQ